MRKGISIASFVITFTFLLASINTAFAEGMQAEHFKTKEQCLNCHGKQDFNVTKDNKDISLYVDVYKLKASVHGEYECRVCHSFQQEHVYDRALTDRVSEKCAYCHTGAVFDLKRSIHIGEGEKEKPNCVSCHGGHSIKPVNHPQSMVSGVNIASTCAKKCHDIQYNRFVESFHGKAIALGAVNAPSCSTCHGSHKILSKTNRAAITSVNKKHFLCSKCHEGDVLGVGTTEHYEVKMQGYSKPMYHIKTKMPWLIIIVMGVFLVHIILDLLYRIRTRSS